MSRSIWSADAELVPEAQRVGRVSACFLLDVHHSPDLFHVQQETGKATGLALAGQTRRAYQAVTDAERTTAELRAEQAACQEPCPLTTPVAELQQPIEQAVIAEAEAQQQRAACQQRQQQAIAAR